ncbi:MAG: M48 family metallopeptidase [Verrucomicrobiales bacterium]|nr:M48 family metallopeptidase [Verrucomicrobiales bacterium]
MNANLLRFFSALLISGSLLWAVGCSTVPITGRKQLSLVSPAQEMELGLASFQQMKQQIPISRDASAQAMVEKVGRRIAAVASKVDLPNAQWEFVVFDSKEMNAFCLPGGKVGVYTGLLGITQDEAGLATVLGHEVAHAAAHHGGERMSEAMLMQTGGQIVGSLAASDPRKQAGAMLAYGLVTQYGRELPHSRRQEAEADEIGLMYMARAGYNPRKALDFWQRFSQATAGSDTTPSFFRTHPVTADRIKHIQELLPKAESEFARSAVPSGR